MSDQPAISIVMGVYNQPALLAETLESICRQTETDWECIIVNDGSTDPGVQIALENFAATEPRARIIKKKNEGLTRALMDGCANARGKYIARIDNGDVMVKEKLRKQKQLLEAHPAVVLATCWTEYCGPAWEHLYTVQNNPHTRVTDNRWVETFPKDGGDRERAVGPTSHPSVLMRASAYQHVGGYRAEFYHGQDWDLWYRLSQQGSFAGIQEVLYRCRIFPDGISMQNARSQLAIHNCSKQAFRARLSGADEEPFLQAAKAFHPQKAGQTSKAAGPQRLGDGNYFIGEALRRNGNPHCRHYLLRSLKHRPLMPKVWFRLIQTLWIRVPKANKTVEGP